MARKSLVPSQLVELLLSVAADLAVENDRELAGLAGVSPETVVNWRTGAVQELKPQKLDAVKRAFSARIRALLERAGHRAEERGLVPIEVDEASSPAELQRKLRELIHYDYLGHRFLYFEPQGALAWEKLISTGYEQELWLRGVSDCATAWLDCARDVRGQPRGVIARALGLGRRGRLRGLDVISLGPGEGGKEALLLEHLNQLEERADQPLPWLSMALADVSIALLLRAASAARKRVEGSLRATVFPFCADFEEGEPRFIQRLPSAHTVEEDSLRLVVILGNVFGNLRDEETFVRHKLLQMIRPGDLVWLEVGVRPPRLDDDPLFRLTLADREETAAEANRRLLLEGPFRRFEVARGRAPGRIDTRVWVREDDDASRIPGSCNFCHDLVLHDENRTCTMLYSRRYELEGLTTWLGRQGFAVEKTLTVADSRRRPRVAHILLRRE